MLHTLPYGAQSVDKDIGVSSSAFQDVPSRLQISMYPASFGPESSGAFGDGQVGGRTSPRVPFQFSNR